MQRILAIALLTLKAAVRFRLVITMAVLLFGIVLVLPVMVKHDGTARGLVQIVLTYTLGAITAFLGFATLWLACGTLARDIEECQIQLLAVKPVARWQIWIGKWLGILALNAILLGLSGAAVFVLIQLKARELTPEQRDVLRREVLVSRGSVKEPVPDLSGVINEQFRERQERIRQQGLQVGDEELRKMITEEVKRAYQLRPPGFGRRWILDMSALQEKVRDLPLQLRLKFHTPQTIDMEEPGNAGTFLADIRVGPFQQPLRASSLSAGTYHELDLPPNLLNEKGELVIEFRNYNDVPLLFPLDDGLEVLYREGGFGLNFARGLGILFCWLALLAAMGLCAASRLSFPVAAMVSLGLLFVALSSDTIGTVVSEGTYMGINHDEGSPTNPTLDAMVVPVFRVLFKLVNLVREFSPIDALSSGRSITWLQLGQAFAQVIVMMGGLFALVGIATLTRRELATAQHQA